MELFEALKNRRSIRRFRDKPVPDEALYKVIEAGTWAPSAHNKQPWHFIVIRDKNSLESIAEKSKYAKFLPQVPVAIVVCAEFTYKRNCPEEKGLAYFSIQDSAAAIENILLAAYGMGLGTCWVGDFNETLLRPMLEIPAEYNAVGIIALGYPEAEINPKMPQRKSLEEVVHHEKWND